MSGDLKICTAGGYIIVALANIDPPAADDITGFAAKRLPRSHLRPLRGQPAHGIVPWLAAREAMGRWSSG
jgi:hypothetical protein